jgi:hypothetical protein
MRACQLFDLVGRRHGDGARAGAKIEYTTDDFAAGASIGDAVHGIGDNAAFEASPEPALGNARPSTMASPFMQRVAMRRIQ